MLFSKRAIFIQTYKQRLLILLVFVASIVLLLNWTSSSAESEKCFADIDSVGAPKLEDILLSAKRPTPGKSIFFHETSCARASGVHLSAREACAVESAALMNPHLDVFVLFAAPRVFSNTTATPIIDALHSYSNIYLRNVNLWTYAAGSPIYEWLKDGKLFESKYVISHTSDFLRYLTLWKWGGTYLDLDVIVKTNLETLKSNFAGAESEKFVAAGVLNFDNYGFGHQVAELCLRYFQINFDGDEWGNNGPGVITKVLQEICKTKSTKLMSKERCFGFSVFPKEKFYAVRWWDWNHFFENKYLQSATSQTNKSAIVHVWNKHSKNKIINVGAPVAYGKLAEKFCPKVYRSCGEYF